MQIFAKMQILEIWKFADIERFIAISRNAEVLMGEMAKPGIYQRSVNRNNIIEVSITPNLNIIKWPK